MDRVGVGLACALLLLIQDGNGANLIITSANPSPTLLAGETINLTITYSSTPSLIIWTVNGSIVALRTEGTTSFADNYKNRATLQEKYLYITGSTTADSGEYLVKVNATNGDFGSFKFNVVVRGRVQEIQSNDTGIYKTGDNITLTIWYEGDPLGIFWNYNDSPLVIKSNGYNYISPPFNGRMILSDTGSLLISNTTMEDAGKYSVNVSTSFVPGSRTFQVKFYDIIKNVTVRPTPAIVDNRTPLVNMSCRASSGSGSVTWKKDGQPVNNDSTHTLLDQELQILHPNKTFSGTYSCNMSNPVSWNVGSLHLIVNLFTQQYPQDTRQTQLLHKKANARGGNVYVSDENQNLTETGFLILNGLGNGIEGDESCHYKRLYAFYLTDPVENVTVIQSLQTVSEKTSLVNLSCSASSGNIETVTWMKDGRTINKSKTFSLLDGYQILQIIQPTRTFTGNYSCNISNEAYWGLGSLQLRVYDPVVNVKVTQLPEKVNNTSPLVNLSCSASSSYIEEVTWTKDGKSLTSEKPYSLLDGNQTLQIIQPNQTFNGIYTCNMSNAAYWGPGSLNLIVSCK
ncbi:pregnancy-specific beta-1-glycoprotein 6-like [Mantella aurantiaca]